MKRDNAKVEKIRNLCKLSTKCKELYTPMLEAYDKGDMELPDLLYQFALMEIERQTKGFSYNNLKKDETTTTPKEPSRE